MEITWQEFLAVSRCRDEIIMKMLNAMFQEPQHPPPDGYHYIKNYPHLSLDKWEYARDMIITPDEFVDWVKGINPQ